MRRAPTRTIDVGRLELTFVNLLSNAIKYSDEAKSVRWVEITGLENADGGCQIAVRDNGLGIPPDSVAKVFERFTRAHAQRDDAAHVDLGFTSGRRTPVKLDRRFVEAEVRIATGLVEPHFMAGYSGGRKVIAPGIAHEDTIRTFHSARFMEDPLAVQCNLDGNPLHEEQLAIVRMLGEVYALNTVIDDDRHLVHVNFGEVIASHLAAVDFVAGSIRVPVGRRFKTILTSAAGHPPPRAHRDRRNA